MNEINVEAKLSSIIWILGLIMLQLYQDNWTLTILTATYGLIMIATTNITIMHYKVKK